MNSSNETQETKHLDEPIEEVAKRWEKITKIFEASSAMTGKEREKFLKASCGDDAEMRSEIDRLLGAFEDSESFMQKPAVAEAVSMFEEKRTLIGKNPTGKIEKNSFVAGTVFASRYRILGMLGKGGMGEVYKAEDIKLGQTLALKFLPDNFQKDSAALERFHAEVRNARQVSHPNVCRVFDIGEIDGKHFLSMEFIDGDDLSSLLRRVGRLSSERAIEIARQLCVGLSAIHNAGILHRDFKPANIIIDKNGKARITDFGIAGVEAEIAKDNLRVGTPAYMSPEQITGKDVSAKSDIYALGLVLYEIFTGKQAIQGDSVQELIHKQTSENPTNPSEFIKGIDPQVEKVISQCIEKDPKDRPATALHVAMALPGGNPMQIALDAGQTPTPEMIAASPKKGALKPKVALAWFAFFVVAMISLVYIQRFYKLSNLIPLEKSSEVLAENAKRMIKNFGYSEKPIDSKYHFIRDGSDFISWAKKNGTTFYSSERVKTGQPAIVNLLYRQSPQPLMAWHSERVSVVDPPMILPGMITILTDTTGRLIEFNAVPSNISENKSEQTKPDWKKFFDEAGLDINKFESGEAKFTPPFAFDERSVWQGTMADWADIPIQIEAASYNGKPIYFRVVTPWSETTKAAVTNNNAPIFVLATLSFLLIAVITLVWYNVKSGRADLNGTAKISLFFLVSLLVISLFRFDHVFTSSQEFNVLVEIVKFSLFWAVFGGLIYCALEPYVRRWWSEYLISWSRLLAGDFRNPMIGRDILVGGALACLSLLIAYFGEFINESAFGEPRNINTRVNWNAIDSFSAWIVETAFQFVISTGTGLGFLSLFLIVYILIKNKTATAVVAGILVLAWTISRNDSAAASPVVWISFAISLLPLMFFFNRFGIVTFISWSFFAVFINTICKTFDPNNILFAPTATGLAIMFGAMAYAAYLSIGEAKIFSEKSFEAD
ncbi:MAG: protein kinase [Acidobacteriota bacterium]